MHVRPEKMEKGDVGWRLFFLFISLILVLKFAFKRNQFSSFEVDILGIDVLR